MLTEFGKAKMSAENFKVELMAGKIYHYIKEKKKPGCGWAVRSIFHCFRYNAQKNYNLNKQCQTRNGKIIVTKNINKKYMVSESSKFSSELQNLRIN